MKSARNHLLTPHHILVVEDDEHVLKLCEAILHELCPKAHITTAETLEMAETEMQHEPIDLLVTDMWFPRSEAEGFSVRRDTPSGELLLRRTRHGDMGKNKQSIPVVLLSDDDRAMASLQTPVLEGVRNPTVCIDKKDFQHGRGYVVPELKEALHTALYKLGNTVLPAARQQR